jgi:hypothetical protein
MVKNKFVKWLLNMMIRPEAERMQYYNVCGSCKQSFSEEELKEPVIPIFAVV